MPEISLRHQPFSSAIASNLPANFAPAIPTHFLKSRPSSESLADAQSYFSVHDLQHSISYLTLCERCGGEAEQRNPGRHNDQQGGSKSDPQRWQKSSQGTRSVLRKHLTLDVFKMVFRRSGGEGVTAAST
jgi:hypothetical protein